MWHRVRDQGTDALVIRVPRLRDIGWGAALPPVVISFLVLSGTFAITNEGGTGSGNVFYAKSLPGDLFFSLLVLTAVTLFTLVQPRRAGYLAAAGLTCIGAWVLLPCGAACALSSAHMRASNIATVGLEKREYW